MEPLADLAVLIGGLLALFIVVLTLLAAFGPPGGATLLLDQALRRQGDDVAHRAIASGSHDFAVAVKSCLACNEAAQCRAWLSSGAREGYQNFCPNAGYIERLKS